MKQETTKPGPVKGHKAKTLVMGEIAGIRCGWDNIVIPPDQVYELAELGLNNKEISRFYNVSDATIARNFVAELQKGREMTKIKLRRAMMHNAITNMHASVQIFLAKNILGMADIPQSSDANAPLPWDATKETNEQELRNDIIKTN
tara:strand:+ start:228 stop:665 length:438 start_codon:yes stop_codon:yes gene_type:complete